jgi:DNA replication protein DnaC
MSSGTAELDRTRALLVDAGFEHVPQVLPELIEQGVKDKLALGPFLELVCSAEKDFREERRVRTSLKLSGLSTAKTLDSFDFAFQRGVHKGKVELLATCEFAKRRENVLLLGPPGVGKTHLATGLGIRAIQNGFSVAFMSADELIEQLRRDDATANRRIRRRKYMNTSVLIIDELGFQAFDRRDAHLLFKVISYRYERGATIITSNKSIREWPEMLAGDDALATAILDRLLHHCHVVQIDGRSFRLREIEKQIGDG